MVKKAETPLITKMSDVAPIEFVTSGIAEIDELTGGYPKQRITQIYGLSSVGKTTVMIKALAEISKSARVLYLDVENAINTERVKELGGDLSKIDYSNEAILEDACELVRAHLNDYEMIVVDSIAMLVPRAEHDGELGEAHVGLKPRRLGQWLRMIEPQLARSNCALVLINQLRRSMEMFSEKYVLPGGMQLDFSSSLKLQLTTTSKDRIKKGDARVGHWINVRVTKSKVCTPYTETKFKLTY